MSKPVARRVEIVNRKGLHARASAKLAGLATTLPCDVTVSLEGESANAKSIMDLLCLAAHQGSFVTLSATGSQAEACLDALTAMITDGFGELDDDAEDLNALSQDKRR